MNPELFRHVDELEISVRLYNCLQSIHIKLIGELVQWTPAKLLKTYKFGNKSISEIKDLLGDLGLTLGMKLNDGVKFLIEQRKQELTSQATQKYSSHSTRARPLVFDCDLHPLMLVKFRDTLKKIYCV